MLADETRLKRRAFFQLRCLALKAAKGKPLPWKAERYKDPKGHTFWSVDEMTSKNSGYGIGPIYKELTKTYAQYIAAASPKTILLLIDDLESLECNKNSRIDELLDALSGLKIWIGVTNTQITTDAMLKIDEILEQYKDESNAS